MKLTDFSFHLPPELIARTPAKRRDHARLMVVERQTGQIKHQRFDEIPSLLSLQDFLVINDTRVVSARLLARVGDKKVEMLVVKRLNETSAEVLAQPAKYLHPGTEVDLADGLRARVLAMGHRGRRTLQFSASLDEVYKQGYAPLPPYIKRKEDEAKQLRLFDLERYQTVYAGLPGAVAAPTAGLHFTPQLLHEIKLAHPVVPVTLKVGEATFQKIEAERLQDHRMGREEIEISVESARQITALKAEGKSLLAVGTTSVRTLETWAALEQKPLSFTSEMFIYPGFQFKLVDHLLTNFHLPESSLFILVSAFAGLELMQKAYKEAIAQGYHFFSYGDAMLIR